MDGIGKVWGAIDPRFRDKKEVDDKKGRGAQNKGQGVINGLKKGNSASKATGYSADELIKNGLFGKPSSGTGAFFGDTGSVSAEISVEAMMVRRMSMMTTDASGVMTKVEESVYSSFSASFSFQAGNIEGTADPLSNGKVAESEDPELDKLDSLLGDWSSDAVSDRIVEFAKAVYSWYSGESEEPPFATSGNESGQNGKVTDGISDNGSSGKSVDGSDVPPPVINSPLKTEDGSDEVENGNKAEESAQKTIESFLKFFEMAKKAIDSGFGEARSELGGPKGVIGRLIDRTYSKVQEKLELWKDSMTGEESA